MGSPIRVPFPARPHPAAAVRRHRGPRCRARWPGAWADDSAARHGRPARCVRVHSGRHVAGTLAERSSTAVIAWSSAAGRATERVCSAMQMLLGFGLMITLCHGALRQPSLGCRDAMPRRQSAGGFTRRAADIGGAARAHGHSHSYVLVVVRCHGHGVAYRVHASRWRPRTRPETIMRHSPGEPVAPWRRWRRRSAPCPPRRGAASSARFGTANPSACPVNPVWRLEGHVDHDIAAARTVRPIQFNTPAGQNGIPRRSAPALRSP